jgi:hypothetical protein
MQITSKDYSTRTAPAESTAFGGNHRTEQGETVSDVHAVETPPFVEKRWGLADGQSVTETRTTATTTTVVVSGVAEPAQTDTVTTTTTVTFVGIESVTVPAGTYSACRFQLAVQDESSSSITEWVLVGTGLPVKRHVSADGVESDTVATQVIVNGVAR